MSDGPFHILHNSVQVRVREEWRVVAVCHDQATAALVAIALERMGITAADFEHTPSGLPTKL